MARQSSGVLVVDAYNVLHTQGVLPPHLAGPEVHELIEMIGASRYKRHRAVVVCDGAPGVDGPTVSRRASANEVASKKPRDERRSEPTVDVVFAGPGREADEAIETLLMSHSAARRMLVVSTDRRVRRAAKKAGASSLTSAEFLLHLAADLERHKGAGLSHRPSFATDLPLSRLEVSYWLAHMGMEGEPAPGEPAPGEPVPGEPVPGEPVPGEPVPGVDPVPRANAARSPAEIAPIDRASSGTDGRIARKSPMRDERGMASDGESARVTSEGKVTPRGQDSRVEPANTQAGAPRGGTPHWMHEAVRAWAGRLNLEELDTGKWLDSPLAPDPLKDESPTRARPPKARRKK